MTNTRSRVPPHLQRFVVQQDYAQYTAVDQAVWRFVLLQMFDKLQHTAHPAYRHGLADTGISVERIPSLQEMDECLNRYGWGAVGVNGFIPPRAFTEFQAVGLLPICAEIRTSDHLVYTPAPDIIHEAAGHAPLIVDPKYANFLKRIGEVGAKAFRLPEDDAVYDAIFTLSELKERPGAAPNEISDAEIALERAHERAVRVSEATRVSRLYWWTAEYGLVGTPADYLLYGAGLLSSLWESHNCHAASVRKLPLSAAAADVAYDITRAQPQLFVARDFDQLSDVLDEVAGTLAYRVGGPHALEQALASQELCTLSLDTGLEVIGQVSEVLTLGEACNLVRVSGRVAFAEAGSLINAAPTSSDSELWLLIGRDVTGDSLARLNEATRGSAAVELALGSAWTLRADRAARALLGRQPAFAAEMLRLERGAELAASAARATWICAGKLCGARAGASDPGYYEHTGFSAGVAPLPRTFPAAEMRMFELYARALEAHHSANDGALLESFERIHRTLEQEYPGDWLLRWNVLESLVKRRLYGPLSKALCQELGALEREYEGKQPIASGLRYLGFT